MIFANVTDIAIPQGNVIKIQETNGGRVLWEKKQGTPEPCSVWFNCNGGRYLDSEGRPQGEVIIKKVNYGELVTPPEQTPYLSDNYFVGWYLKDDLSGKLTNEFDFTTPITDSPFQLYAKWEVGIGYTISFNLAVSSPPYPYGEGSYTTQYVKAGEKAAKPEDPKRTGYTFNGWWYVDLANNYTDTKFDFNTLINQSYVLSAKWI